MKQSDITNEGIADIFNAAKASVKTVMNKNSVYDRAAILMKELVEREKGHKAGYYAHKLLSMVNEPLDAATLVKTYNQKFPEEALNEDIEQLDEIKMAPGTLLKKAMKMDAKVGLEFEMYVPGYEGGDSEHGEYGPSVSDWGDIYSFFDDENSDRDMMSLKESLHNEFMENYLWEKMSEAWSEVEAELTEEQFENDNYKEEYYEQAKEHVLDYHADDIEDGHSTEDDFEDEIIEQARELWEDAIQEEIDNQGPSYERAREDFEEDKYNDGSVDEWFDEWVDDKFHDCDDVRNWAHSNDIYLEWPNQEGDFHEMASEFESAVGREANWVGDYHSGGRSSDAYDIEYDSSLESHGVGGGFEFISPPLSIEEMFEDLDNVIYWAKMNDATTDETTGLHMNISLPHYDESNLDHIKLLLLYGEDYIQEQFDRTTANYCRSMLEKLEGIGKDNPHKVFDALRSGMDKAALHVLMRAPKDKVSIYIKNNRVEFRSPGNDWLNQPIDDMKNAILRFIVALDSALDPEKDRKEYMKKLYMLVNSDDATHSARSSKLFAEYASGKIGRSELKSGIKGSRQRREDEAEKAARLEANKQKQKEIVKGAVTFEHYDNGMIRYARWYNPREETGSRKDGPVAMSFYENGVKQNEIWRVNGNLHREDGPADISWYNDGTLKREEWLKDGHRHRDGGKPADISYYRDGSIHEEEWYENGRQHREDGPAWIRYNTNGEKELERWYFQGRMVSDEESFNAMKKDHEEMLNHPAHKMVEDATKVEHYRSGMPETAVWMNDHFTHRDGDKPAIISFNGDGSIKKQEWWIDGRRHRDGDKPAYTELHPSGAKHIDIWYKQNKKHREGEKPAMIDYYNDGTLRSHKYFINDRLHSEKYPAISVMTPDGTMEREDYYINGEYMSKDEWEAKRHQKSESVEKLRSLDQIDAWADNLMSEADQVKAKEPMPKKKKPSGKQTQKHPYRGRLVGGN